MELNEQKEVKLIDVREAFRKKSPALLKILPGFFIQYLRRIVHEDELNDFIARNHDKSGLEQIHDLLAEFGTTIKHHGLGNLPKEGRYLVASNHPLGGLDGLALIDTVSKVRKDLLFPVNDILMNIPNAEQVFIPINKHGSNAANVQLLNDTFASDVVVLYFPFGLVSRKRKGKIADLEWKKTFLVKSIKNKRDIIPTHIDGRNSNFFYNLANLRKFLRIKTNLEMLFLANEMYKQHGKTINITFGKPIPYQTFDKRFSYAEWAAKLKDYSYSLEQNPNAEFNY